MRPGTAVRLAMPAARTERARFALVAASTAAAGALLLTAARVATLPTGRAAEDWGLAPYVEQDGLRPGVAAGALLLTVPVLALAGQALRVGSAARERRMAALRLAGATPGDTGLVAAVETGAATTVGAVLAGPAYLLLWLVLGLLPVAGLRLMPPPAPRDVLVWAVLLVLAAAAGAAAGYQAQHVVPTDPLAVHRRSATVQPGRFNRVMLATGALLTAAFYLGVYTQPNGMWWVWPALIVGALLLAFAGGPRLVRRAGRRLQRRGGAEQLLAGRRLEVDPRPAGRVVAVLLVCGAPLGLDILIAAPAMVAWLAGNPPTSDEVFAVNGFGAAATAAAFATTVAMVTLAVGAADQLLEARRPLASLAALGVEEATLLRVLRRQLSAATVPAVALGGFVGIVGMVLIIGASGGFSGLAAWVLPGFLAAALGIAAVLGLLVSLFARVAVRPLRRPLRATLDPESLRAP